MRNLLTRIAAWAVERPAPVVALAILLSLVGAVGALGPRGRPQPRLAGRLRLGGLRGDRGLLRALRRRAGADPDRGRPPGADADRGPGDDPRARGLPVGQRSPGGEVFGEGEPAPPACARLAEEQPAETVFGPATFLNQTAITAENVLTEQTEAARTQARGRGAPGRARGAEGRPLRGASSSAAAQAAYQEVLTSSRTQLIQAATQYGLTRDPATRRPDLRAAPSSSTRRSRRALRRPASTSSSRVPTRR